MANVNPKDAQLVNEHLVQCLRDSVMVQNQTQIVHWGLLGSKFYQIHLLTVPQNPKATEREKYKERLNYETVNK